MPLFQGTHDDRFASGVIAVESPDLERAGSGREGSGFGRHSTAGQAARQRAAFGQELGLWDGMIRKTRQSDPGGRNPPKWDDQSRPVQHCPDRGKLTPQEDGKFEAGLCNQTIIRQTIT